MGWSTIVKMTVCLDFLQMPTKGGNHHGKQSIRPSQIQQSKKL